jgi:maltodextrin utilization protein YvdJ
VQIFCKKNQKKNQKNNQKKNPADLFSTNYRQSHLMINDIAWPVLQTLHIDLSMMFYQSTIIIATTMCFVYLIFSNEFEIKDTLHCD